MVQVSAEQIRELWDSANPVAEIELGDDLTPITKDDLAALADALDTDDDGYPLPNQWQVIADQLNSNAPGEPTTSQGDDVLDDIAQARARFDLAEEKARQAKEEFHGVIRAAMLSKTAPVTAIREKSRYSRERLYQIRDGRR